MTFEAHFDAEEIRARIIATTKTGMMPTPAGTESYLSGRHRLQILKLKPGEFIEFAGFNSAHPMEEGQAFRRSAYGFAVRALGPGQVKTSVVKDDEGIVRAYLGWQPTALLEAENGEEE